MRFIARYAKDKGGFFELWTIYDKDIQTLRIDKSKPYTKTLSHKYPSAIWFERKIQDDFGIKFEDAFDKRLLVHHERFKNNIHPMLKSFQDKHIEYDDFKEYEYETVDGDGVYQVSVGPIHAGIIEPGHFHFSQAGEKMLHLEVRHFYTYRAIEKMLEGRDIFEAKPIIERISGNESIAYQIAWRDIVTQACRVDLPKMIRKRDAFLLELERVIHHLTDLGFIPNDAGFSAALSFASKLAEDARRKMSELTGHRFGFGAICFENRFYDVASIKEYLYELKKDVEFFEDWVLDIPSLMDRFDTTGILSSENAIKYSTVGVVARASSLAQDRRLDDKFYMDNGFCIVTQSSCDVAARFKVRLDEVKNSLEMMHNFLNDSETKINLDNSSIVDGEYMSFVESSIGELLMVADIKDSKIDRFFVRDASFVNWQSLHLMMQDDIIADFPLINKSCDLSYAGNDL